MQPDTYDVPSPAPLSRFGLVDTTSPDEAREAVGRIFCPHFLTPLTREAKGFHARHHSAVQAGYSVNFVAYGSAVEIDPGELSRFFLLQVPLKGAAQVRCGTVTAEVTAGRGATVLSPTLATRMTWQEECEKVIVLIRREELERLCGAMLDQPSTTVEFSTGIDLAQSTGAALFRHVDLMRAAADGPTPVPEAYQVLLRDGLATLMLTGLAHDRSASLDRPLPSPGPAAVRRAEDYLAGHAGEAIAMADVAKAAGASLRALQDAFRQHRGQTLTERLQEIRLERLRAALTDRDADASVTDMIFRAGLGHAGRAAAAYAARYGEMPSQTRRRR